MKFIYRIQERLDNAIWALGRLTPRLAGRLWDLSDWINPPPEWSPDDAKEQQ